MHEYYLKPQPHPNEEIELDDLTPSTTDVVVTEKVEVFVVPGAFFSNPSAQEMESSVSPSESKEDLGNII